MITDQNQIFNFLNAKFSRSKLRMYNGSETNWKLAKTRNFVYFVVRVRDDYLDDTKSYLKSIGAKRIKYHDKYAEAWYTGDYFTSYKQRWYSDIRFEIPKLNS